MSDNPFEVTKAVDFTDEEIAATWVDLPGGGFATLADPKSPMPRFLVGGKGGGRTHLLRYFSYALQRVRHREDILSGVRRDGYLGIYFRCGGLNSSRFAGKRQDSDAWSTVFSYYTEVWLGRLTLDVVADVVLRSSLHAEIDKSRSFTAAVLDLFDVEVEVPSDGSDPLGGLGNAFRAIQRKLDIAINNAALTHRLDLRIGATPGRLVFGIPTAAARHWEVFSDLAFAYLLDEYENLTLEQQRYINTLIREKELPTTFIIGSRLYGVRTHETLSAGEENRQGSEFDRVTLEDTYRSRTHKYNIFCLDIVRKRLEGSGFDVGERLHIDDYLEQPRGSLEELARRHTAERLEAGEPRPWLRRLESHLQEVEASADSSRLMAQVQVSESPLHEKFAILLLYREWANGGDLMEAATKNRLAVEGLMSGARASGKLGVTYKHYRVDLYAQLLAELGLPQEYYGFTNFVQMSGYLPRNLLVVLKQVTRWSLFLGEDPFRGGAISFKAQLEGVREASSWFLSDAKSLGRLGEETQIAVRRLAGLFRDMRFCDKPVEVSCSAFATDRQGLSGAAARVLDDAVEHSLVLSVPTGRRERNTRVLQHKYQLNPMLAPLFDLSLARRGSASFSASDLSMIFDTSVSESAFGSMRRRLLARMQAPFRAGGPQGPGLFD